MNYKELEGIDLERFEKLYDNFDKGHDRQHLEAVRSTAVELAKRYCPDKVHLAYLAGTLHDIGLVEGREGHEERGARLILIDPIISKTLPRKEVEEIAHAVREHRANNGNPQTILAKVVSDADKTPSNLKESLYRAYHYGVAHYKGLSDDEQVLRAGEHLCEKFGKGGTGSRVYFEETGVKIEEMVNALREPVEKKDMATLRSILNG